MSLLDFFGAAAQVGGQMLSRENELDDKRQMEVERERRAEEIAKRNAELAEEKQKRIKEWEMELGIRKQNEANKKFSAAAKALGTDMAALTSAPTAQ